MHTLKYLVAMAACAVFSTQASSQSAKDIRGSSPLVAIENEAPAKLIVDPPLPEPVGHGPRLHPISNREFARSAGLWQGCYGSVAAHRPYSYHRRRPAVALCRCQRRNDNLVGLDPGPHKVLIELADPTHKVITSETVKFTVPDIKTLDRTTAK